MVKEDPIKIVEKEHEKEASQETMWPTAHKELWTGMSTTLNREEAQIRFSTGIKACPQLAQACRQPESQIGFWFLFDRIQVSFLMDSKKSSNSIH